MEDEVVVYFDKECPICREYSKYIKLREKFHIKICNAREYPFKMEQMQKDGFDINDGIILEYKGKVYQGVDALTTISDLTVNKSFFDRFISFLIKIPYLVKIIYPLLKLFRLCLLKVLGIDLNIPSEK